MNTIESGYAQSEFDDATIVCIDGEGELESISVWTAQGSDLEKVYAQQFPHSVGMWYSAMEERIGLDPNRTTLLELSDYGDPNRLFLDVLHDFIATIGCGWNPCTEIKHDLRNGCMWWHPELFTEQDLLDIAAATQQVYIYILQNIVAWSKMHLPSRNLVLEGLHPLREADAINLYQIYNQIYITR